ncbi:unnamed protein product [Cuscuta europaea]|uniref:Uncharacterized protein n=1 Tax=Cuscuta europaea TaxID=41803 RepID=A0A9P0YN85_CUSEU|nr:unnamed protein product [Cuscuta europaea]
MDSQDHTNLPFTSENQSANYGISSQNLNQFNPMNNPMMQPMYHFDPTIGAYAIHIDQHNRPTFPFQHMLNTPMGTQNIETVNALNKRAKDIQDPNLSQNATSKKDWTTEEEVALTEAWLYISTDADVGTNKKVQLCGIVY